MDIYFHQDFGKIVLGDNLLTEGDIQVYLDSSKAQSIGKQKVLTQKFLEGPLGFCMYRHVRT